MAEVAMTTVGREGGGELVGEGKGRSNWPTSVLTADQLILAIQIRVTPNNRKHRFLDRDCLGGMALRSGPSCYMLIVCKYW